MKLLTKSLFCFAVLLSCCTPKEKPEPEPDSRGALLQGFNVTMDKYSTRASINLETGSPAFMNDDEVLVSIPATGEQGIYKFSTKDYQFVPSEEPLDPGNNPAYVYYPASLFSESGGKTVLTMPGEIPAGDSRALGQKAPMAGVIPAGSINESGKASARFMNLCSIIRVQITGAGKVKEVKLENQNVPVKADGSFNVAWSGAAEGESPSLSTDAKDYSATIKSESSLNPDTPADYYFMVPATAESMAGMKVTATFNDLVTLSFEAVTETALKTDGQCRIIDIIFAEKLFSGGSGTETDPYVISTAKDLQSLQEWSVNGYNTISASTFQTAHYVQTADINMNGKSFSPIGSDAGFKGVYDGRGQKITGLKINMTQEKPSGLFGKLDEGGVVKNVNLEGLSLTSSWAYTGGIAGIMEKSTVDNCSVTGTVNSSGAADNKSYTGGIAGRINESTISSCRFEGKLVATSNHAGGIVGTCDGDCTVSDCTLKAGSSVQCNYYCGGIAASLSGAKAVIRNCSCEGSVTSTNWNCAGILAVLYRGTVSSCMQSNVSLVSSGNYNVGGIVGAVITKTDVANYEAYIDNCVSYGTVRGLYQVGGICGLCNVANATEKGVISNCACVGGTVVAIGMNSYNYSLMGGICGYLQGNGAISVENCFSRPDQVNSTSPGTILAEAALIGYSNSASHTLNNCYTSASPAEVCLCGQPATSSSLVYYGSIIGRSSGKAVFNRLYYNNSLPLGPASGSNQVENYCAGYSVTEMTDGTLLAKLSSGVASVTGASGWIAGADGYPTLQGLPEDTVAPVVRKRVSIIGDSISTFKGWIQADKVDDHRYCSVHYPKEDITTVDQTWWYSLIYNYMRNGKFEMNISGGNTTVVQNWTATASSTQYWYGWDFCTRFQYFKGVGRPDIVFIHGGTNDLGHIASYGASEELIAGQAMNSSAAPSASALADLFSTADACTTISEAEALDFSTFCSAYIKLVKMIKVRYPSAKIVCIIGDCVSGGQSAAIKSIADHYGAKYVDFLSINGYRGTSPLTKYTGNVVHPDANGMDFMAKTIYQQLGSWLEE